MTDLPIRHVTAVTGDEDRRVVGRGDHRCGRSGSIGPDAEITPHHPDAEQISPTT